MGFYDYSVKNAQGEDVSMKQFEGKVVIVVNTATGCGFTPHYEPLEKMYEEYHEKGLEILDIPCNQFMGQTLGTDEEIHEFCQLHYNTQFPQMKKSDVNGENQLELFKFLKGEQGFKGFGEGKAADMMNGLLAKVAPGYMSNPDIKWNFTKFIIDRQGNVVARFEPTADMAEVEKCAVSLL